MNHERKTRLAPAQIVRLSKKLSLHLRHRPQEIGLQLEAGGWVNVDDLLRALQSRGINITRAMLEEVVRENDKQRFAFDQSGERIRASQGHSVEVDLQLSPLTPPPVLFHGTNARVLAAIAEKGLQKMRRHHVHLSPDEETAHRVGARRGDAVILRVLAGKMHDDGHAFFRSQNGVWLTESVPPHYIEFPETREYSRLPPKP
jgi:putative RNA 2'-phosphotransferase